MKRIKLLFAALAAMVGMSAYAQTDDQYNAALNSINSGEKYSILTEFNSSTYYLKTDGHLTDKLDDAGVFTFASVEASGTLYAIGWNLGCKFTNPSLTNGSSGDVVNDGSIHVGGNNRNDWERQVFFLNDEGKYAVRSTNANSSNWGANTYWDVLGTELPEAGYSLTASYVWKLQNRSVEFAKKDLAQLISDAEALGVSTTDAQIVYEDVDATLADVNAAIVALKTDIVKSRLVGADAANPVDATFVITNPAPYANGDGWIVSTGPTYDSGNKNAEYWNKSGASIKQVLPSLPAGSYVLEVIAFTRTNMIATLSAGEASMNLVTVGSNVVNSRGDANTWFNNGNGVNKLFFSLDADANDFEIGLTADNTTGDHWMVWRSFKLTYYGDATEEEIALAEAAVALKKAAEATAAYEGQIPGAAYTALQGVVADNNKVWATVAEYEAATKAIVDATDAAKALVYPYNHYKIVSAAATALDDDTDAFTGDATIDVSEADAAADAATDEAGLDAAVLKVQAVVNAFLDAVNLNEGYRFDITNVYLENPDFNRDYVTPIPGKLSMPKGWEITISGQNLGQQNRTDTNSDTGRSITDFIEAWIASPSTLGAGVLAQKVSALPEGTYVLECDATGVWQGGSDLPENVELFIASAIKTEKVQVQTGDKKIEHYSQSFAHGGEGAVQFGLRITDTGNVKANWISADNFKVYYAGPMPLSMYDDLLNEAANIAQDYDKDVPAAAYDALQEVALDNLQEWKSKDEYRAAIAAINAAVEATDKLVAPYADYKALVNECKTLQAVDNDNAAANATFEDAIENDDIEDALTVDDIETAKKALAAARLTYVAEANPAQGAKFDLTFMLTNPDLTGLPTWTGADGWYTEEAGGNSQVMTNDNATSEDGTKTAFYEYWQNPAAASNLFALYLKVNLPVGTYNMSCYAFAQDDYTHINHPNGVYFYANDVQGSAVNNAKLSQAQIEFVNAEEQEVKIGLKTVPGNVNFWMGIGYVELYKVAPKTIEIAENVDYEPETAAGKVKLTRTIKADTWNTFVVPFALNNEELKAAFGDDVEVAEESEVAHGDLSTISFTKMETPAITPNKPVLLKTSTAGTVYEFENRTIATSEPVVVGTNFDFVGTYKKGQIAAGDYFIGSNKLFLSDGSVNIAGTHAYLKAKAAEVKAELFIDGVATAIESIDAENAQPAGAIYNVAGQRVQKAQRGLYIMGGKKVMVK